MEQQISTSCDVDKSSCHGCSWHKDAGVNRSTVNCALLKLSQETSQSRDKVRARNCAKKSKWAEQPCREPIQEPTKPSQRWHENPNDGYRENEKAGKIAQVQAHWQESPSTIGNKVQAQLATKSKHNWQKSPSTIGYAHVSYNRRYLTFKTETPAQAGLFAENGYENEPTGAPDPSTRKLVRKITKLSKRTKISDSENLPRSSVNKTLPCS